MIWKPGLKSSPKKKNSRRFVRIWTANKSCRSLTSSPAHWWGGLINTGRNVGWMKSQQISRRPKQPCWTGGRISRKPKHLMTATMGEHNCCVATTFTQGGSERGKRRLVQPHDLARTLDMGVGGTLRDHLFARRR